MHISRFPIFYPLLVILKYLFVRIHKVIYLALLIFATAVRGVNLKRSVTDMLMQ